MTNYEDADESVRDDESSALPARVQPGRPTMRALTGLFGLRMLALVVILVQSVVLARVFGPANFGAYSFAISVISVVLLLASLGLDQVMMRDLAAVGLDSAESDYKLQGELRLARRSVGFIVVGVSVVGVLACLAFAGRYQLPLLVAFATLGVLMVRKFAEGLLLGAKKPALSFAGSDIVQPVAMLVGGALVGLLGLAATTSSISIIYVVAVTVATVASLTLAGPRIRGLLFRADGIERTPIDKRATLGASMHLTLVSSGFIMSKNLDVLLTGVLAGPSTVAIVRVLARLGEAIAIFRQMALLQYRPYLAEAGMNGDKVALERHTRTMSQVYVLTGLPLFIVAWLFARTILSIYGPEYVDHVWAFRVYMIGILLLLLGGPTAAALSMSGLERYAARALWASLAVSLVLNLTLIPNFGAMGCALASAGSTLVLSALNIYFARTKLGIDTSVVRLLRRR